MNGKLGVRRAIIVAAGRGINSKMKLKAVNDNGYRYIDTSKMKEIFKEMRG